MYMYMHIPMYMDALAVYTQSVHGAIHIAIHVQRSCCGLYSGL
jgi:hypothetical protein